MKKARGERPAKTRDSREHGPRGGENGDRAGEHVEPEGGDRAHPGAVRRRRLPGPEPPRGARTPGSTEGGKSAAHHKRQRGEPTGRPEQGGSVGPSPPLPGHATPAGEGTHPTPPQGRDRTSTAQRGTRRGKPPRGGPREGGPRGTRPGPDQD
ncbi:proline-rich protein 2-like [Penaeus indicus]|uniref:proline-rich protein 2-like n=1 Tax=Penaeus indicus TaxID=29960 RepID=UPI00300C0188